MSTLCRSTSEQSLDTAVMKFGGAASRSPDCFRRNARLICEKLKTHKHAIAVVSAMGATTDELLQLAHSVNPQPPPRELDMLISTGERVSGSLLAMALAAEGVKAQSFTGSQAGIITSNTYSQARILDVKPHRIRMCLEEAEVAIVAGFQGVSEERNVTTLGRGGTDTTAVALAVALGLPEVEFFKEVRGVYSQDPLLHPEAKPLARLTHDEMLALCQQGAKVLHDRSVILARANGIQLKLRSFLDPLDTPHFTLVGTRANRPSSPLFESLPGP